MLPRRQASIPPIPSTVSDHACIDFVNSRFADHLGTGPEYDRLEIREWQEWFATRCASPPPPRLTPGTLRELRLLRELLRDLLAPRRPPSPAELAELNRVLGRRAQTLELVSNDAGFSLRERARPTGWPALLAQVVESYADLLVSGGLSHVRVCANPACSWIFHDISPGGRRRWCDVRVCGNLIKVRHFRSVQGARTSSRRSP